MEFAFLSNSQNTYNNNTLKGNTIPFLIMLLSLYSISFAQIFYHIKPQKSIFLHKYKKEQISGLQQNMYNLVEICCFVQIKSNQKPRKSSIYAGFDRFCPILTHSSILLTIPVAFIYKNLTHLQNQRF